MTLLGRRQFSTRILDAMDEHNRVVWRSPSLGAKQNRRPCVYQVRREGSRGSVVHPQMRYQGCVFSSVYLVLLTNGSCRLAYVLPTCTKSAVLRSPHLPRTFIVVLLDAEGALSPVSALESPWRFLFETNRRARCALPGCRPLVACKGKVLRLGSV